jgi:hypothetical protein
MEITTSVRQLEGEMWEAIAVLEGYVTSKQLNSICKYAVNQPIVVRHNHPLKGKGGSVIGRVVAAEKFQTKNKSGKEVDAIRIKFSPSNTSEYSKKHWAEYRERGKKGETNGISVSVEEINDGTLELDGEVLEFSMTPIPACEECLVDIHMPEPKELEAKLGELQTVITTSASKIKELEAAATQKDLKIKEYEDAAKTKDTLMQTLDKRVKELEDGLRSAKIAPLIARIKELESPGVFDDLVDVYKAWPEDKLAKHIKELEKRLGASVKVESMATTRVKALESDSAKEYIKALTPEQRKLWEGIV